MAEPENSARESGTTTPARTTARWIAILIVVASGYYLGGRLGLSLALVHDQVTPLWPPTGIAVVSLLFFGRPAVPGLADGPGRRSPYRRRAGNRLRIPAGPHDDLGYA